MLVIIHMWLRNCVLAHTVCLGVIQICWISDGSSTLLRQPAILLSGAAARCNTVMFQITIDLMTCVSLFMWVSTRLTPGPFEALTSWIRVSHVDPLSLLWRTMLSQYCHCSAFTIFHSLPNQFLSCLYLGFCRSWANFSVLLECGVSTLVDGCPTFRNKRFSDVSTFEDETIALSWNVEHPVVWRKIREGRRPQSSQLPVLFTG